MVITGEWFTTTAIATANESSFSREKLEISEGLYLTVLDHRPNARQTTVSRESKGLSGRGSCGPAEARSYSPKPLSLARRSRT